MSRWIYTVDLSDIWDVSWDLGNVKFSDWLKKLLERLKAQECLKAPAFSGVLADLEYVTDLDEFDEVWDELYEIADAERVWINTNAELR